MDKRISYEATASLVDSSRHHRPSRTDQLDILRARCELLSGTDRVLMELLLQGHCTSKDLAALLGISESALSHRIRHLTTILGGLFFSRPRHPEPLSSTEWKVARMAYLNDQTAVQIVRHTGLSLYRVKQIIRKLKIPEADDPEKTKRTRPSGLCSYPLTF